MSIKYSKFTKYFSFLLLLFSFNIIFSLSNSHELLIKEEGAIIYILDFKEGDQIKLFEVMSGTHILTKSRNYIDLSQLPKGQYQIVDNNGGSIVIDYKGLEFIKERAPLSDEYVVAQQAEEALIPTIDIAKDLELYQYMLDFNPLEIIQEGNKITVVDFEDGDELKVYEFQDKNHILTKSNVFIDLSLLPEGRYLLENNHGQIAIVKKIDSLIPSEKKEQHLVDF